MMQRIASSGGRQQIPMRDWPKCLTCSKGLMRTSPAPVLHGLWAKLAGWFEWSVRQILRWIRSLSLEVKQRMVFCSSNSRLHCRKFRFDRFGSGVGIGRRLTQRWQGFLAFCTLISSLRPCPGLLRPMYPGCMASSRRADLQLGVGC